MFWSLFSHSSQPSRRPGLDRSLAVVSVLVLVPAFILSLLCLLAGNSPGVLEEYAIFTLNISRIGENLKDDLDHKIASIDFNFKRSPLMSPGEAPVAMITALPSTLVTKRAPFDVPGGNEANSVFNHVTSDAQSLESDAKSKVTSLKSKAKSEATHVKGEITSAIDSGLTAIQSEVIKLVNEAYQGILDGLHLTDFYSLHLMTICSGLYVTSMGKYITVGGSVMPDDGTHKHVYKCKKHSALDPVQLVRIVYLIGIVFVGAAFFAAVVGVFWKRRWFALCNIGVTGVGFSLIGLATAVTHGVAVGAGKLINFIGQDLGVEGQAGLWKNLSWACVGLLGFNMVFLWPVIWWLRPRNENAESRQRPPAIPLERYNPQVNEESSPPRNAHLQRNYVESPYSNAESY